MITWKTEISFGKYSARDGRPALTLLEIWNKDRGYVDWLTKNVDKPEVIFYKDKIQQAFDDQLTL